MLQPPALAPCASTFPRLSGKSLKVDGETVGCFLRFGRRASAEASLGMATSVMAVMIRGREGVEAAADSLRPLLVPYLLNLVSAARLAAILQSTAT